MQNDKLLPCPFCGGEAEWGTVLKTWIVCRSCGFETPYSRDTENTVRLWNTRKPMERIVERLEEMFKHHSATKTVQRLVLETVKGGVDNEHD